jgi:capsular exopolysaccharide synthesis family protein
MSRIDEALKRAAEDSGEVRPADAGQEEMPAGSWTAQYPKERGGGPVRIERVVPRVQAERNAAEPSHTPAAKPERTPVVAPLQAVELTPVSTDLGLVTSDAASSAQIEQYRRLAATLHEAQVERGLRRVAITSALPEEGKTLTAANLALTLSESFGRRVLLIDADLRRPGVHAVFGVANASGLTEALSSPARDPAFAAVSPRLSVLTAGRVGQNPLAALSSERMRELLEECSARFDWVLLDTPPVGVLSDAQVVARLAGSVLLVIAAGSTSYPIVERAVEDLGRECIIGTVLNRVDDRVIPEARYYRYDQQ